MNTQPTPNPAAQTPATLCWVGGADGHLVLLDQTLLPLEIRELRCCDVPTVWEAIKQLRVRGAPAIGLAAAYGLCIAAQGANSDDPAALREHVDQAAAYLATSRPTAVNLFWALERMRQRLEALSEQTPADEIRTALLAEARAIHDEDRRQCQQIGQFGAALLSDGQGVLTHCNAGGLATSEYGTALALFFAAHESGKRLHIYVDETRPLWQGSRLTAWELQRRGIDATLICDSMAAQVMRERRVQAVVTGADRIAANGDTANKIGTYSIATLAKAHGIPFYIAAPTTTFDLLLASGAEIPIEERDPREITHPFGRQVAPDGICVYNPAFDVTPAELIAAIVCERGIIRPVTRERIAQVVAQG